jgi:hypothetical protein
VAVEIYSTTSVEVLSYWPQLSVGANSPVTSTVLTLLIKNAAAQLNGVLRRAGLDPADVATDTASDHYQNAQAWVAQKAGIAALYASHHGQLPGDVEALVERVSEELEAILRDPLRLGYTADTSISPSTTTSTSYRSLTTTTAKARTRRFFDSRRPGKDEGGFYH